MSLVSDLGNTCPCMHVGVVYVSYNSRSVHVRNQFAKLK